MQSILYLEINIFCIMLILLILRKVVIGLDTKYEHRMLIHVIVSVLILFLINVIWYVVDMHPDNYFEKMRPTLSIWINTAHSIQMGICAYFGFLYSEYIQNSFLIRTRKMRIICSVPLMVMIVLTLFTVKTRTLFYVDANQQFQRGSIYFLQVMFAFSYLCVTALKAFIKAFGKRNYVYKQRYLCITQLAFIPIVCSMIQTVLPDLLILNMGITFSLINIYLHIQSEMISIDPLTQINNRNQVFKIMNTLMKNQPSSKELYLVIMDIDSFKQINDLYGHIQGDEALRFVGQELKETALLNKCFVARYGGDEFILLSEVAEEFEMKRLCYYIQEKIKNDNKMGIPLSLSIGYAKYTETVENIPDFIALADREMYTVKRRKKHAHDNDR